MKSVMVVSQQLGWPRISPETLRRAHQVEVVRSKRLCGDQEVAFGARPFILCGLPIRRLRKGDLTYRRRNGKFFLEVVGHPDWGIPFGQDRLVLLHMATLAVRYQSPAIYFRSGAEILVEWGMPTNGIYYKRLVDAFQRVFGSTMFFGTNEERRQGDVWDCTRVHFFDSMKLWKSAGAAAGGNRDNSVTLSPAFWQELQDHPIPVDAEVIRLLARNPGCLDLYTWLTWRCHQAKGPERVPLFGSFGLANQLGVQDYQRERKFRERIRTWLKLVRLYWPECPAAVASNGTFLEINTAAAILARSTNAPARPGVERAGPVL
jgi:hypothetical protein